MPGPLSRIASEAFSGSHMQTIWPALFSRVFSEHKPQYTRQRWDAPEGSENWFVMVNAPKNDGQNWDEMIKECRKNILLKLEKMLNTPIEPFIVSESILDPRSIESKTSSYKGALYGSSSNSKFSTFMRHKNFSSTIKNLYFFIICRNHFSYYFGRLKA